MLAAILLGIFISLINVAVHCSSILSLRRVFAIPHIRRLTYAKLTGVSVTMALVASILMLAHFVEILVWSFAFIVLGVAEEEHVAVYDAFLSYTSLGFSLSPQNHWRLLEPISTLNGILMAGLSTAIMFEVLVRLTARAEPATTPRR